MRKLYTYEFARRSGDHWSVSWHRMGPERRSAQEIARGVLERWIIGRTAPLPAGRVVVHGRRHVDLPPSLVLVRVRVYDRGTVERVIAPSAVAYLTALRDDDAPAGLSRPNDRARR